MRFNRVLQRRVAVVIYGLLLLLTVKLWQHAKWLFFMKATSCNCYYEILHKLVMLLP